MTRGSQKYNSGSPLGRTLKDLLILCLEWLDRAWLLWIMRVDCAYSQGILQVESTLKPQEFPGLNKQVIYIFVLSVLFCSVHFLVVLNLFLHLVVAVQSLNDVSFFRTLNSDWGTQALWKWLVNSGFGKRQYIYFCFASFCIYCLQNFYFIQYILSSFGFLYFRFYQVKHIIQ